MEYHQVLDSLNRMRSKLKKWDHTIINLWKNGKVMHKTRRDFSD